MSYSFGTRLSLVAALLILIVTGVGCNKPNAAEAFNATNARRVRTAYNIYTRLNGMKGPKTEEAFKGFFRDDLTAQIRLKRIGVTPEALDGIFVSERDGKPFKIRYGLNGSADHAVVFEEEGVDGLRQVALWDVVEVGNVEYDNYFSGKTKPAADPETIQ